MSENIDPKIEAIAKKVISKIDSKKVKKDNYGNPIMILMVISIILTLVRVIQECNKPDNKLSGVKMLNSSINNICVKKTWWNQMRLSRIIKKQLSKEDYKEYGNDLKNAILDCGISLTEDESLTLMEASNV